MLDSEGVEQLSDLPHASTVGEVLEQVWGYGEHVAYLPRSGAEVDQIVRACRDPGGVNLLVDEAHNWLTSRRGREGPLLELCRAHRHSRANVLMTTQHYTADIPQEARSCAPRLYVFRCTAPAVLKILESEGWPVDQVRVLPQGVWIEHNPGF